MPKHAGMSLYSWSTKTVEPTRVKVSHHAGDKLPMGYESGEKEGGENHEIRTTPLEIKPRVHLKAVLRPLNMVFLPISRSRFRQRQIPLLKNQLMFCGFP